MALRNPLVLFIPDPWIRIGWKNTVSPLKMFKILFNLLCFIRSFVTFFHWQFYYWMIFVSTNSMIHLVDTFFPIRIVVLMEYSLVRAGQDNQASIIRGDAFHSRPGAHDSIGRSEGKVMQVLYKNYVNKEGQFYWPWGSLLDEEDGEKFGYPYPVVC